jgi:predicted ATPase
MDRVHAQGDRDAPGAIPALWANWVYLFVTGRMTDAADLGARLRRAADRSGEPGALMMANLAEGTVLFDQAQFEAGIAQLDQALQRFDPAAHGAYRFMYGQDPKMYGMVFKAWALWCAGSADEAAQLADDAVTYASTLGHPNSYGFALGISGLIHQCRGDLTPLTERVATLTELSVQQGWVQWHGLGRLLAGAADVLRGEVEPGVAAMQEARAIGRMIGEKSGATHYDAVLADGLCRAGRLDDAAALLATIRDDIVMTGERAFEADVVRLEGEVARLRGDAVKARQLFEAASAVARSTGARAYEARAAASLAALG